MMNRHFKKVVTVGCSTMLVLSMTGCSLASFKSEDVKSYDLEPMLTEQEIIDYYAKALDYDAVITRNLDVHETKYVEYDITGEKAEKLKALTSSIEQLLGQDEYEFNQENAKLLSEDSYNYIKATIDNEVLTNGKIQSITGALGYYFVDVQYDITAKQTGQFNQLTTLLGLDGVFIKNMDDTYSINTAYLISAVDKLNEYYFNNRIMKVAEFDEATGIFSIHEGTPINPKNYTYSHTGLLVSELDDSNNFISTGDETSTDNTEASENTEEIESNDTNTESDNEAQGESASGTDENSEEANSENAESTESNTEGDVTEGISDDEAERLEALNGLDVGQTYASIVSADRKIQFNVNEVNKVAGSSITKSTYFPTLKTVYNLPEKEGTISGYGICIAGGNGMRVFGLDRSQLKGTMTIRYVFKDDSTGTGEILGKDVFVKDEAITTGFNVASQNVNIPAFLLSQLEQTVERVDRVQCNYDISGAMSGELYEDMGYGVLLGYKGVNTDTLKNMSTIRQIVSRDTTNNSYLAEVETTVIDGARASDVYGTYRDKSYVVIQQQGDRFIVVDWLRMSRETVREPEINPDTAIQKRLVALNLAGEIPQESKDDITQLLSNLYTAGTNRLLRGPKTIKVNGNEVTLDVGIHDCFQSDVTMLSTQEFEYETSLLQNKLIKYGTDKASIYSGTVTEWIGGYENQAELTTEELISYEGNGKGHYMQVYYLVSNMNDKWVIDQRKVLDEYEVDGAELDNIKSRVGQ